MYDQPRAQRAHAIILAVCIAVALVLLGAGAAALGHRAEVRVLVAEGKPRPVADCMVRLRQTWGECEVGMFTGTYPAAWDSVPDLARVRDAVHRVRAHGGRWTFGNAAPGGAWSVCAELPGRPPRCATDVRSASALAFGGRAPQRPPVQAISPARRRACTGAALASLRRRAAKDAAARTDLAERARACGVRLPGRSSRPARRTGHHRAIRRHVPPAAARG